MAGTKDLIKQFKKRGHRFSAARNFILDLLVKNDKPLSVFDLQKMLKKKNLFVNKTTVYREINLLKEEDLILEIQLRENKKRYELSSKKHHHHIVCINCNKIEDVILDKDLDQQEKIITKDKKFKIINHSLEFFGVCHKCQK